MQEIHFIPETVSASNALQLFLRTHQQLAMVVDDPMLNERDALLARAKEIA